DGYTISVNAFAQQGAPLTAGSAFSTSDAMKVVVPSSLNHTREPAASGPCGASTYSPPPTFITTSRSAFAFAFDALSACLSCAETTAPVAASASSSDTTIHCL